MQTFVTVHFDSETERTVRLRQALSPDVRARIVPAATRRVFALIQGRFRDYAQTHHRTADALGAPHTKHMERAARNMSHEFVREPGMDAGRVILKMAGIGRAFHDVDIRMGDRRLTIPIARESYGKSVADIRREYGEDAIVWFRSRKGNTVMGVRTERGRGKRRTRVTIPLFVLKESVHQRRDPDMVPSEAAISQTAKAALVACIDSFVGGGGLR